MNSKKKRILNMDIFCMTSFKICFFLLSFTAIKMRWKCVCNVKPCGRTDSWNKNAIKDVRKVVREEFGYKEAPTSLINVLDL